MKFLEKDLEDIIYNNTDKLYSKGLDINRTGGPYAYRELHRQVPIGAYGVADLINVEYVYMKFRPLYDPCRRRIAITVIECKLNRIDIHAYLQAQRYISGLKQLLTGYKTHASDIEFNIVLIGQSVDTSSDFIYTYNNDDSCKIFTYKYGFDGISFEQVSKTWEPSHFTLSSIDHLGNKIEAFHKAAYKHSHTPSEKGHLWPCN